MLELMRTPGSPVPAFLDVKCGSGMLASRILAKYPSARVVCADWDADEKSLRRNVAKEGLPVDHVRFEGVDIAYLPFPEDHFDVVTGTMALSAAAEGKDADAGIEAQKALLREMVRVCKPGGQVVCWDVVNPDVYGSVRLGEFAPSKDFVAFGGLKSRIVVGTKVGRG
ncbi:S-adenosyl-L-methionine-dependent methyltransferase [Hyaloraphidium curvatum]|nr:S-adenosyl-L-methionine-dependent methyltransferase [Hyaloraphidium curvatum]